MYIELTFMHACVHIILASLSKRLFCQHGCRPEVNQAVVDGVSRSCLKSNAGNSVSELQEIQNFWGGARPPRPLSWFAPSVLDSVVNKRKTSLSSVCDFKQVRLTPSTTSSFLIKLSFVFVYVTYSGSSCDSSSQL